MYILFNHNMRSLQKPKEATIEREKSHEEKSQPNGDSTWIASSLHWHKVNIVYIT